MDNIIKKFNVLFDKKQKIRIFIIFILMIIGALLETVGVTLILPLVSTIMDQSILEKNQYVKWVCNILDINSAKTFIISVIFFLIFVFIFKGSFLLFEYYVQNRFVYNNRFFIQQKLLKNYLHRPYQYFLHINSGEIIRVFTNDVVLAFELLITVLLFFTETIILCALIITLFIIDPLMTLLIAGILGILMFCISIIIKPILKKSALTVQQNSAISNKWIMQSIHGIKEIKVANKEKFFRDQYVKYGEKSISAERKRRFLENVPRLLIETVSVAGILMAIAIMIFGGRELSTMLPQLSAFAMATVRLMPSANRLNTAFNAMSYYEPSLDKLLENLKMVNQGEDKFFKTDINKELSNIINLKNFNIKTRIELSRITYSYPNSKEVILNDASMIIPIGKSIGIIGTSGEGKTTTVDILIGLLKPNNGRVLVDGIDIRNNYKGWLSQISYIPQMIYMLDDTIRANIAFGYSQEDISETRIWNALEDAKIADVVRNLPKGLDTEIGERGIRLSGGQKQRIGIARALYTDPQLLIFDEATAALDNETESGIMESIRELHGKKTIVIIAHRLGTIKDCDIIYRVRSGKILEENGVI